MEEKKEVNNLNKILGIMLLVAGLGVMGYSLFSSVQIFQGEQQAPQLFDLQTPEQENKQVSVQGIEGLQDQIPELLGSQLQGLLPYEAMSHMMNLVAWSILASILLFGGAQIAGLGIKLIKT
jgi:hypothetical protein